MGVLDPVNGKLGKLLRLLGSDRDGEVVATGRSIVRVLEGAGLDLHVLADNIDGDNKIAEQAYKRGIVDGRRQAEEERRGFRSVDALDEPTWHEIACECAARESRLDGKEREFVADMVRWTVRGGKPTEKQAKWLRLIFMRVRR
jgi:hypothetical protein